MHTAFRNLPNLATTIVGHGNNVSTWNLKITGQCDKDKTDEREIKFSEDARKIVDLLTEALPAGTWDRMILFILQDSIKSCDGLRGFRGWQNSEAAKRLARMIQDSLEAK